MKISPYSENRRSSSAINIKHKKRMSKLHTDFDFEFESERKKSMNL